MMRKRVGKMQQMKKKIKPGDSSGMILDQL